MSLLNFFNNTPKKESSILSSKNNYNNDFEELHNLVFEKTGLTLEILFCDKKHSSGRVKTSSIEIRVSNNLPKKVQKEHIENLIKKILMKIEKKPDILKRENHLDEFKKAISQGYFYLGERIITLKINSTKTMIKCEEFNDSHCILSLPKLDYNSLNNTTLKGIERKCGKLLCELFQKDIEDKVNKLNVDSLNSKLGNISFNYVTSKWGHCTGKNDIMLHIALLNAPNWVYEYVILHELAHTIHKNHSSKFWDLCNKLTPHTKASKQYLKLTPPIIWKTKLEEN